MCVWWHAGWLLPRPIAMFAKQVKRPKVRFGGKKENAALR